MKKIDFEIRNHGTVAMIAPMTKRAKKFVADYVSIESWQWIGDAFAAEPRMAVDLVSNLKSEGYSVSVV